MALDTNIPISKVTYNGVEVELDGADLQEKTVKPSTSEQVVTPDTDYDGLSKVTVESVNLQEKTIAPSTSEQNVTADGDYDGLSKVTVEAMPTATQATPSITVGTDGLITASATQTAGYVAAGTKSATHQLTTQAAKTVTPTTSNQTAVASGVYTTGAVTVKGDANLTASNIASGKSIFGVTGTYTEAPVLLWTNASPTSNFAKQTLTFSGSYEGFIVACKYEHYYNVVTKTFLKTGEAAYALAANNLGGGAAVATRYTPTVTANSITFEGGCSSAWQDYYCIPLYIWGVKSGI